MPTQRLTVWAAAASAQATWAVHLTCQQTCQTVSQCFLAFGEAAYSGLLVLLRTSYTATLPS